MIGVFEIWHTSYEVDFAKPIDISLPVRPGGVKAWYVSEPEFEPVSGEGFVGSVAAGGSVNFRDVRFNPHGHGTHTETVGHISPEIYSINTHYSPYTGPAALISVTPEEKDGDQIVTRQQVLEKWPDRSVEAVVIRTLPNHLSKKTQNYSHTNPPYLEAALLEEFANRNILHVLVDLPSVDREMDEGRLNAHKAFWTYPENPRSFATITELVYVPDSVQDGLYLLALQVAPLENDAAPSRPLLCDLSTTSKS